MTEIPDHLLQRARNAREKTAPSMVNTKPPMLNSEKTYFAICRIEYGWTVAQSDIITIEEARAQLKKNYNVNYGIFKFTEKIERVH